MKKDIILSGVGGQGILTIAAIIDWAALDNKLHIKQAEVHGMSQRGGDVQSHLRISSEEIYSDLIPKGSADIILSVEPMEALRHLPYLSKSGYVITANKPYKNIPNYPSEELLFQELDSLNNKVILDAETLAKEAGSIKAVNIVMLGAASKLLAIPKKSFIKGIAALFSRKGEDVVQLNSKAFELGAASFSNFA